MAALKKLEGHRRINNKTVISEFQTSDSSVSNFSNLEEFSPMGLSKTVRHSYFIRLYDKNYLLP